MKKNNSLMADAWGALRQNKAALFSFVIMSMILPFSTNKTVTGTEIPESKNSLVMPIFFPINPIAI